MVKVYIKSIQSVNFTPVSMNFVPVVSTECPCVEVDELTLVRWCEHVANFKKTQAEILSAMNAAYGKDGA
jgi:hypothetical protein